MPVKLVFAENVNFAPVNGDDLRDGDRRKENLFAQSFDDEFIIEARDDLGVKHVSVNEQVVSFFNKVGAASFALLWCRQAAICIVVKYIREQSIGSPHVMQFNAFLKPGAMFL